VAAARGGVVTRAGWVGAYGYLVVLDHGGGWETRYAHLSRIDVHLGERLPQGATVGLVGSTGASTGPHLHFEVRREGQALDPLAYLER
jgi:murein DD-endopeptidase MepM/ murein hydrolase activator NlpD